MSPSTHRVEQARTESTSVRENLRSSQSGTAKTGAFCSSRRHRPAGAGQRPPTTRAARPCQHRGPGGAAGHFGGSPAPDRKTREEGAGRAGRGLPGTEADARLRPRSPRSVDARGPSRSWNTPLLGQETSPAPGTRHEQDALRPLGASSRPRSGAPQRAGRSGSSGTHSPPPPSLGLRRAMPPHPDGKPGVTAQGSARALISLSLLSKGTAPDVRDVALFPERDSALGPRTPAARGVFGNADRTLPGGSPTAAGR